MSFLIVVADITFLIFVLFNSTLSKHRRRLFLTAGIIALVMLICNIIVYTFRGTGEHILMLKLFSAVSYGVSGPVVIPFVMLSSVIGKKVRYTLLTLAGVNAALCIISIFNGCIFSYDAGGNETLGPLSTIPFFLCAVYIAVLLSACVIKFRLGLRSESIFILVLCVFIILAVILNTTFKFKYLISGMAVLSCVFYYLFFTTQILTRDALTNAFNRHSFYKDIQNMRKQQMYVISIDLNDLKTINDTQGHDAGDRAILALSDSIFEVLPPKCRFYRMGGDEFEILYPGASEEDTKRFCDDLCERIRQKGCSAAIGYSEYTRQKVFDDVLRDADAMMYENKAFIKSRRDAP